MRSMFLAMLLLGASVLLCAASPLICRVQGGNTRTIWGVGFTPGQAEVWGWSAPNDDAAIKAALNGDAYSAKALLPATPPAGARKYNVLDTDANGQTLAVDFSADYTFFDAMNGPDICWVKNAEGYSNPWPVRCAQPWMIYPEKALPGERIRVIGRNINALLIAIKPATGAPIFLTDLKSGRNAMYEANALLPADLKPGKYQLYVHNGAGGAAGWGGPIALTIKAPAKPVTTVINARELGAKGDGITDDTVALRNALLKAGKIGNAIVLLPPGRYAISKTIWVPSGVTLQGAGMFNSTLCVAKNNPLIYDLPKEVQLHIPYWFDKRATETHTAPMLWMWDNSTITDLGFEDGPGVENAVFAMHDNCHIERCKLYCPTISEPAVIIEFGSYGFTLKDCEIEASSMGLFMVHGPHEQAYVGGNTVRCTKPGIDNNIFIRAFSRSIIENNISYNADRNFCSQSGMASAYHSILQGNSWFNNIPRRHNSGENMYESGNAFWHGKVLRATANTLSAEGKPFEDTQARIDAYTTMKETFVLIIAGRGIGQYRKVISYTPDTLTLERPWDVVPDATTYVTVGRGYVETLWVDNTEEHTANWTGWWGNTFGNVIDGQILRDGEGIYLWAYDDTNPSPVAFNELIGSELIGRAQVRFIGPLVFGNSIQATEVINFRYLPSFHGSMTWKGDNFNPNMRSAIDVGRSNNSIPNLPAGAALKDWNVIEGMNIYDGPIGITIASDANHTILRHNKINVDGAGVVDKSKTTVQAP